MPTGVAALLSDFTSFLTSNTIVLLVFAAGAIVSLIVYGVKRLAKGGR
jgi:hypothetical protein